ncbi:hypothetical protein CRYUN_Cryun28dG0076500 [Craigia yunnanensis]
MHFQPSLPLRLLQKLMVVMLLYLVLVSGDLKEESMLVGMNGHAPGAKEKQPVKQQHQRLRHSFGVFSSSKRKVPNASDPLHNR